MAYADKQREITPEAADYINDVFKRLTAICPAWKQAFASTEELNSVKKEWITGFFDSGIRSKAVVDYALSKLRESGDAFIPPVGRFIGWCREGNLPEGTKNSLQGYKEVCEYQCLPREKRQPSGLSPEVWHTLNNLGDIANWRQMDKLKHKKYWDEEHEITLELLRNGGVMDIAPPPRQAIERQKKPLDKTKAISRIQAMREQLK